MPHVNRHTPSGAFWPKPVSLFGLFSLTTFKHRFTSVHHTDYLALTRIEAPRRELLSQFAPRRNNPASGIVLVALDSYQ